MNILRNPMVNSFWLAFLSAVYGAIMIIASKQLNITSFGSNNIISRLMSSKNALFIGLFMIFTATIIDVLSVFRRKKYDEYQVKQLEKTIIVNGLVTTLIVPILVCGIVFFPLYGLEIIFILFLLQWIVLVISEVYYLINNYDD